MQNIIEIVVGKNNLYYSHNDKIPETVKPAGFNTSWSWEETFWSEVGWMLCSSFCERHELQVWPAVHSGNSFVSLCYFYCTTEVVLGAGGGRQVIRARLLFLTFSPWELLTVQCPRPVGKADQLGRHHEDSDFQRQEHIVLGSSTPGIRHRCMRKAGRAWRSRRSSVSPGKEGSHR